MYSKTKVRVKINGMLHGQIHDYVDINHVDQIENTELICQIFFKFKVVLFYLKKTHILLHLLCTDDLKLILGTAKGLQQKLNSLYDFCK